VDVRQISKVFIILGAALGLATVAGLLLFPRLVEFWNRPLGPGLGFEETATATSLPGMGSELVKSTDVSGASLSGSLATKVPSPTPTPMPEPYCGGPEVLVVMAVGIDYRRDSYLYGLADVIKIVRVDYVIPQVTVLSIPRDLWVEVPDISDHYGITHAKLNQAYFYGTEGMGYYDGPGFGAGLLARTLDLNFGIRPDHYGVINMATFEDIVNVVGGIDIYLPVAVNGEVGDPADNMGYFPEGWNHLDGDEAVRFARIRKVDTVFNRMDRQTQVLCAVREKLLSAQGVMNLPQIIHAFSDRVLTDLSPSQMAQMACLLPKLDAGGIVFTSFPQELFTVSSVYDPYSQHDTFTWDVDFERLRDYVVQFLAGEWPVPVEGDVEDVPGLSCQDFP
jgi:LCP family protein required for cell wall assembly